MFHALGFQGICLFSMHLYIHMYVCMYMQIRFYMYMYMYMCMCMFICTRVLVHVCVYVYVYDMYTCARACMCAMCPTCDPDLASCSRRVFPELRGPRMSNFLEKDTTLKMTFPPNLKMEVL